MFAINMQHILYHCNTYNINANINVHILNLDECIYIHTDTHVHYTDIQNRLGPTCSLKCAHML